MKNKEVFISLLDKYITGDLQPGEYSELFHYIDSGEYDQLLDDHIQAHAGEHSPMANLPPHRAQEIMVNILSSEKSTAELIPVVTRKRNLFRVAFFAAATLLLAFAGILLFKVGHTRKGPHWQMAASRDSSIRRTANTGDRPFHFTLEEGTSVELGPGASLSYPIHFSGTVREVALEGSAFFKVSKSSSRPFYVYCGNLVTHVLGTSFSVRPGATKNEMQVDVLSGKVEVYEDMGSPADGQAAGQRGNGVILTPNQRVTYHEDNHQFVPSVIDRPMALTNEDLTIKPTKQEGFVDEPLPAILSLLHEKYGIEIVVDNEAMNHCLFTGDIKQEDLYSQLDILCLSLNAHYEQKGSKILLKGPGCNW